MRIPLWLKLAWTIFVAVWIPVYWRHYGAQNFLYFCDLGNLLIAVALWTESSLIFSWQASGLLLFQTLYTIDLAGALLWGRHPIGGTEYMFDPHLPLYVRGFGLFHVITPAILLWGVRRLGYDPRGWKLQAATACIVAPINYLWRPQYDVNWARGLFYREQHVVPGWLYLVAYLLVATFFVFYPTHRLLEWWDRKTGKAARAGASGVTACGEPPVSARTSSASFR